MANEPKHTRSNGKEVTSFSSRILNTLAQRPETPLDELIPGLNRSTSVTTQFDRYKVGSRRIFEALKAELARLNEQVSVKDASNRQLNTDLKKATQQRDEERGKRETAEDQLGQVTKERDDALTQLNGANEVIRGQNELVKKLRTKVDPIV